jgi:hypothetical protein
MLKLFRNKKQAAFLSAVLNNQADFIGEDGTAWQRGFVATFLAGRGSGKTYVMFDLLIIIMSILPRAIFGIVAKNYFQIQTVIMQQFPELAESYGFTEYSKENPMGQYVVFTKPPDHWPKPYYAVRDYSRTVSWCNGHAWQLASADSAESQRGINWDGMVSDETGSYDETFKTKLIAGIRANKYRFRDSRPGRKHLKHPLHWFMGYFTSLPTRPEGFHVFKEKELALNDPDGHFWIEANAYDNIANLPGNFIQNLRDTLSPIAFQVEVMNEMLTRVANAFYPALDTTRNTYEQYDYAFDEASGTYKPSDLAVDSNKEIILGYDFNSYFTSALVCQDQRDEFRFADELFVKESESTLVEALTIKFCERYKNHNKKIVRVRGDQSGKKKSENAMAASFDIVFKILREYGWKVIDEVQRSYPSYHDRYIIGNALLKGENPRLPKIKIHLRNCKNLIIAMQITGADGANFEKDKRSEKNKNVAQEQATHFTDIFDYIVFVSFGRHLVHSKRSFGIDFVK